MAKSQLSVEMLPALHGDALWVEWGDADERRLLLIDGGPRNTFDTLSRRFQKMEAASKNVELMVITHIDLDHIDGAIKLLRTEELGIHYNDVWFNDYHHLAPGGAPNRGGKQGEYLGAVLEDVQLPWNKAFSGGAVLVPPTGPLPRVRLPGGLDLVLVSPTQNKLSSLQKAWKRTLDKAGMTPGDRTDALERLDADMKPADLSRGGRATFGKDSSKPNGSSIGFIAEYRGERWLLSGDAHADVLVANLKRYGQEVGEQRVRLDGFKLPHHGSTNNISTELMRAIDCRMFLVSTNGNIFQHPDRACIDLVVNEADRPHLVFNYLTPFTAHWQEPSQAYTAEYLDSAETEADREADVAARPARTESGADTDTEVHANTESGTDAESGTDTETEAEAESGAGQRARTARSVSAEAPEVPAGGRTDAETVGPSAPLEISVHHASLETADYPVLVGHYIATPLSGAEGFIDGRFDRRLSERVGQGRYPGAIGQSLLVTGPRRRPPIAGALVVGLGEYGDLTPLLIVETVRAALVDHALDEANRQDSTEPLELGISGVLMGATGDQGISIGGSVRAIVDGVRRANHSLRSGDNNTYRAQYRHVQIFERNAPEAELAFLALQSLPGSETESELDQVTSPTELKVGEGFLTNSLPVDTSEASWWRIRISDVTPTRDDGQPAPYLELEFSVGGRLARVGNVVHSVERRRLERLLSGAVDNPDATPELRTTLFELLFPNQLKWDLTGAQDVQLEVDGRTADIPWEMLEARNPQGDTRGELALRAKLVRQFKLPAIPAVRRAATARALVIGNPPTGHLAPTLPGAATEARAVAARLAGRGRGSGHYEVESLIYDAEEWADPTIISDIETAMLAHDYRIIHIAGHGFFQPDEPTRTGVAIGPDDFITAKMLRQLNVTPDVVFLNCCHVGSVEMGMQSGPVDFTRRNYHRLSASLARELIDCGVRAVVVAGWAVSDSGAEAFAVEFYRSMLSGEDFSTAVKKAREAARDVDNSSTWGAYQCYGDGSYRLPDEAAPPWEGPFEPKTIREVLRRLESLVSRIESVGADDPSGDHVKQATDELNMLQSTADARSWTAEKAGNLCEQFARSWAAIGEFEAAIGWYKRALVQEDGEMTFRGLEQLANLEDRLASMLIREHRDSNDGVPDRARQLIEDSSRRITQLEQISGTGERRALRAGSQKRRAVANQGAAREEALSQSITDYLGSYEELKDPYTLFNYFQLEEIRSRCAGDASAATTQRKEVEAQLAAYEQKQPSERDYWSAAALADGQLTVAIAEDAVDSRLDQLVEAYRAAFDTRSTARQRTSTIEHIEDLAELHPDPGQADALRAIRARLVEPPADDAELTPGAERRP